MITEPVIYEILRKFIKTFTSSFSKMIYEHIGLSYFAIMIRGITQTPPQDHIEWLRRMAKF